MRRGDLRLLPAATAAWALAVLGMSAGTAAAIAGGAVLTALVLAAVLWWGGRSLAHRLLAHLGLGVLAAALLLPALHRAETATELLEDAAARGLVVELEVRLGADPEAPSTGPVWAREGVGAMARAVRGPVRLGTEQELLPASVPLLVRAQGTEPAEQLRGARDGSVIAVRGTVRADGGLVVLRAREVRVVPAGGVRGALEDARHALREQNRRATAHLPPDEAALVRGMTTGDTRGLSETSEEIMRRAGISHLVAVSGANIALVIAAVLGPLLLLGVRRRRRIALAALAMASYVWLVGDEPSVQRAATMAAPLLAARFAGVRASPVAALAMTVALWSVLDPVTAASIGFLLSALATAAILLASPPLAAAISGMSGGRVGRTAALVLAVPLVAQLACTPVLILLAPEISIWAVPVNMVVGPLVGPSTVIGLLALLVGMLWSPAGSALSTLAAGGAHLVLLVARTADALPGSRIAVPEGAPGVLGAIAVIIGLAVAVAMRRHPLTRWVVAAVLVVVLAPGAARWLPGQRAPSWVVAACAVGQGDALLLRGTGADPVTVLVDTGPDAGALRECLDRLQVDRLDLLVLTHPHADHAGGLAALTGDRAPAQQWICPLPSARSAIVPGVPVTGATTGAVWEQEGLALSVLWPPSAEAAEDAAAREDGGEEGAENDCSLAVDARLGTDGADGGGTRLVALGDLEPAAQAELAALSPGRADIVKVAHHGSRYQDEELYAQLDPELALVTVGKENTFGHPTTRTLDMLAGGGADVARTDLHGTVVLPAEDPLAPRSVGPGR